MRYGQRNPYSELQKQKVSLGAIPDETCPRIDKIIKLLDVVIKDDIPVREIELILEDLRKDNAKLRELGAEWYKYAEEMAILATETMDEKEEMEEERDDAISENLKLQEQLNNL